MDPQTLQFIMGSEFFSLHAQIGQLNLLSSQAQARIAELEAANRVLTQKIRELKTAAKIAPKSQ